MTSDPGSTKPDARPAAVPQPAETPISPELERHLSDPREMTEQVSGAGTPDRPAETPTEPGTSTENQPT